MLIEREEQRVLGALLLMDRVTQTPVTRALRVRSGRLSLVRNRRGLYVVTAADGLSSHTEAFAAAPVTPALAANTYELEVSDPREQYLPRVLTLRLPRDPDTANVANEDSLFRPQDVAMYPASTAALSHNWSTIRVAVTQDASAVVRGALIRIIDPADDSLLASGISDQRGEALVIIPGIAVTKFADEDDDESEEDEDEGGESPVVVNTFLARLELSLGASTAWPVNPDVLEQSHVANRRVSRDITLRSGRMERVAINLT